MVDQIALDHGAAIRDFETMLQACTVQAACGRSYVLVAKLTRWLRRNVQNNSGAKSTQGSRLLWAAYYNRNIFLPITWEQLSGGEDCSLLVFSILLELKKGWLVHSFQSRDIVDRHLPIDLRSLRARISSMRVSNADDLAVNFDAKQWKFCPAKFDLHKSKEGYNKNIIIPICKKQEIKKGGTAQLWQIAVQEEFVGPKLREAVKDSWFDDEKDRFGPVSHMLS
jgi:hypothetical protein